MSDDSAVVEAAEAIVRSAVQADSEQLLDVLDVSLRLAADQLQREAEAAQDALIRLHEAAVSYSALRDDTRAQLAALGLPAGDGDSLELRGRLYSGRSAISFLSATLCYILNECSNLPAGSRIEVAVFRCDEGGA